MAYDTEPATRNAVPLRDDSMGVSLEQQTRTIQQRYDENGFYCSLKLDWLNQLGLNEKGEPTLHSMSMGIQPVIVRHPAIIIQPKDVLEEHLDD